LKTSVRFGLLGAFIALAAALGVATSGRLVQTVDAQAPAGLTIAKTCAPTTVNIGAASICTIQLGIPAGGAAATIFETAAGEAIVISVASGNGAVGTAGYGQVRILEGQSSATTVCAGGGVGDVDEVRISNVSGQTQTLTIGGTGTDLTIAAGCTITVTLAEAGAVGGTTVETARFGVGAAAPSTLGTPVTLPASVTVNPATTTVTLTCTPSSINVGSGGTSTCTADFSDNDIFPTTVSSGTVEVVLGGTGAQSARVTATGFVNLSDTFIQGRCGTASTPQGCDSLTFTVTSPAGETLLGPVDVAIKYQPDLIAVNTPLIQNFPGALSIVQPVVAFVQPTLLTMACATAATITVTPGPIAPNAGTPFAIGILPTALQCTVTPTPANVAPGTIEVSSLNGVLISSAGTLTTNLRISCGDPTITQVFIGSTIDPNTCAGVRFAVAGVAVGTVDLRARYEPSTQAAQAGILEREVAGSVFFVAPNPCGGVSGCSLLLNPNPVTVGQTGVATLRFNRDYLLCGTGIICVDPTTGAPILINNGSILNGTVVFSIADANVASWVAAQPTAAAPAPSSTAGFQTTANQTAVRCGFFPTTALPSGGVSAPFVGGIPPLSQFFGGCESASATYRGNTPGVTGVNATFVADLPGATGQFGVGSAFPPTFFGVQGSFQSSRSLEVIGAAPVGDVQLARGCNNVSPTVSEAASAYAARVNPSSALVAIWEHQAATNTFRGWSPAAGAPNDLSSVTRLRPVFVCVSAAATLAQPPA
jgi:hypothetical protein